MNLMDVKPIWFFVTGLLLLAVFTAMMVPRRWHPVHILPGQPWSPIHGKSIIPGQAHLLGQEGFTSDATFYMFGVDWCPHCVSTKPEFEKLGSTQTIGGKTVQFVYVNPEKNPEAAKGFDIDGYPTLILQTGGFQKKYSGPRTSDGFLQFLEAN
jgi:thiol-disulfide isomerase/thioredoxin